MCITRVMFAACIASLALTHPADAQPVFKVGTSVAGFGWPNAKTNAVEGYAVDTLDAIARISGLQIEIVSFASFADVLPALVSKKIDISATSTAVTPERRAMGLDFSQPYAVWTECLVVLKSDLGEYKSLDDLKGEVVGTGNGTTYLSGLRARTGFKEVKNYPTFDEGMAALSKGEVKAYLTPAPQMAVLHRNGQYLDYRVVATYVPNFPSIGGIGVRKGETELLDKINTGLARLKEDGTLKGIAAKWNMLVP